MNDATIESIKKLEYVIFALKNGQPIDFVLGYAEVNSVTAVMNGNLLTQLGICGYLSAQPVKMHAEAEIEFNKKKGAENAF